MKKLLLLIAIICFLAPVTMTTAASKATAKSTIFSFFGKKDKPQPKFRPQSKGVYKIKVK